MKKLKLGDLYHRNLNGDVNNNACIFSFSRSSPSEVFFIEIAIGCSPINLLHVFRTPFSKNISGGLLLIFIARFLVSCRGVFKPYQIVNIDVFVKSSILDVCLSFEYASFMYTRNMSINPKDFIVIRGI